MANDTPIKLNFDVIPPDDPAVTSQLCKSIFWKETTGVYNVDTNPGGWSPPGPNPDVSTALTAVLDVTLSDGTIVSFDLYPDFPTAGDTAFEITNEMLGLAANVQITDWIAKMTYTVTGNDGSDYTETLTKYVPILCQTTCCVNKLALKVSGCGCSNKAAEEARETYLDAQANLDAIYASLNCVDQDVNKAIDILSYLTSVCSDSGCGCGCN